MPRGVKVTFLEQKAEGMKVWQEPFDELRAILTNLRIDPFERARQEDAMGYQRWWSTYLRLRLLLPMSGSGCRASRSFHLAKSPAASISAASWRR
jgi:hypothetical protein